MPVRVELFGKLQDEPCGCGCGQVHQRARGEATRSPEGGTVLFLCLLARHHDERHLWFAIGSGPWEEGGPDCFCSVEAWPQPTGTACRMTEARESPFRHHQLFTEGAARFVARDEVIGHPERKEWLFGWVDELVEIEQFKRFLNSAD